MKTSWISGKGRVVEDDHSHVRVQAGQRLQLAEDHAEAGVTDKANDPRSGRAMAE